MQPLRKDHVDHYKDFVRDEFSLASNRVEREISQQAQDKVEEVGDKFAQVINKNLPSLIKDMQKKEKELIQNILLKMIYVIKRKKSRIRSPRFLTIQSNVINGI